MIGISSAFNEARLQGVINFLAQGTANAYVEVYEAPRPALGDPASGNLLVRVMLEEPVGTLAAGALTLTPTAEGLILVTGQAAWARVKNGDDALAWDCDVSDLNGSGELKMPTTQLYAGGFTRIVSGSFV
jgi:hypothetical protein